MTRWCVLHLGRAGKISGREFVQVASGQDGGTVIVIETAAAVGGRRRRHGCRSTAATPAGALAGTARTVKPSPGAEAGAQEREDDKHEEMSRRRVSHADLERIHRAGREVRAR